MVDLTVYDALADRNSGGGVRAAGLSVGMAWHERVYDLRVAVYYGHQHAGLF